MTPCAGSARALLLAACLPLVLTACGRFRSPHEQGVRYLAAGRYAEAVDAFGLAIQEATGTGDAVTQAIAYANRCYARDALGQHEQAVDDCTTSLELQPDDPEVLNNRGVAYLHMGRLEEAERDFDRAVELRPDYAEALANRGRVWLDREDFERALEDLDLAIGIDDRLAQAYANRAYAKENLARTDDALEDYATSLRLRPDALVHFSRGMLYLRFARFDEAYEDFVAAAKLEPESYVGFMAHTEAQFLQNRPTRSPDEEPAAGGGEAEETAAP
jgi:tetratricopeptide (TPR) repeat protein